MHAPALALLLAALLAADADFATTERDTRRTSAVIYVNPNSCNDAYSPHFRDAFMVIPTLCPLNYTKLDRARRHYAFWHGPHRKYDLESYKRCLNYDLHFTAGKCLFHGGQDAVAAIDSGVYLDAKPDSLIKVTSVYKSHPEYYAELSYAKRNIDLASRYPVINHGLLYSRPLTNRQIAKMVNRTQPSADSPLLFHMTLFYTYSAENNTVNGNFTYEDPSAVSISLANTVLNVCRTPHTKLIFWYELPRVDSEPARALLRSAFEGDRRFIEGVLQRDGHTFASREDVAGCDLEFREVAFDTLAADLLKGADKDSRAMVASYQAYMRRIREHTFELYKDNDLKTYTLGMRRRQYEFVKALQRASVVRLPVLYAHGGWFVEPGVFVNTVFQPDETTLLMARDHVCDAAVYVAPDAGRPFNETTRYLVGSMLKNLERLVYNPEDANQARLGLLLKAYHQSARPDLMKRVRLLDGEFASPQHRYARESDAFDRGEIVEGLASLFEPSRYTGVWLDLSTGPRAYGSVCDGGAHNMYTMLSRYLDYDVCESASRREAAERGRLFSVQQAEKGLGDDIEPLGIEPDTPDAQGASADGAGGEASAKVADGQYDDKTEL